MTDIVERFVEIYREVDRHTVDRMGELYRDDVEFIDPVHTIQGLEELKRYTGNLVQNLRYCRFDCHHLSRLDGEGFIKWRMQFAHPLFRRGREVTLPGISHIRFDSRVYYHEDFYDLGAMVYEHIPVAGALTRWVKQKLAAA